MEKPSSVHSWRRRGWLLAIIAAVLGLAIAGAARVLPPLAADMIEDALADAGFPEAQLHGVHLIWTGLGIDRIDLSADAEAVLNDVVARGDLEGLLAGRLNSLSVGVVVLAAHLDESGLTIAGYAPGDTAPAPPITELPVDRIAIGTVEVDVDLTGDSVRLTMSDLSVMATDDGLRLHTRLDLVHANGRLNGRLEGAAMLPLALPDSDIRLGLEIAEAHWGAESLSAGRFEAHLSGGELDWSLEAAGAAGLMAQLQGKAGLDAGDMRLSGDLGYRGLTVRDLDIEGQRRDGALSLTLVSGADSDIALDMTAAFDPAQGRGSLRGDAVIKELAAFAPLLGDMPLSGRLRVSPDLTLTGTAGGPVSASGVLKLAIMELTTGAIEADAEIDLSSAGMDVPLLQYASGDDWRLSADVRAVVNARSSSAQIESLILAGPLDIAGKGDAIRMTAPDCLTLDMERIKAGGVAFAGLSLPCLQQDDSQPLARHDPANGVTQISLQMPETAISGDLSVNDRKLGLTGRWPALDLSLRHAADGNITATLALDGGAVAAADVPLRLSRLTGDIVMERGALKRAELSLGRLVSTAKPALFTPLTLDIEAQAGDSAGEVAYTAFLSDTLGSAVIRAEGRAGFKNGSADLTLFPVRFVAGGLEIGDLSPMLAEIVTALEGEIGTSATLAWAGDTLTEQAARVTLDTIAVAAGGIALAGLNADFRLSGLAPLATPEPQTLYLDAVTAPLPLSDGRLRIDIAGERLAVEEVTFNLAGGRVHAAPFIVDLSDLRNIALTLQAEDVRLDGLFRLADIDGLSGEGRLEGRLPLRLDADGAHVEDGLLATTEPGVLRYSPETLPDFLKGDDMRTKMLRQALANFRYDALSLRIDGGTTGAQTIRLEATGRNPDFMEGHPVELAFNLQGALLNTVRSAAILSRGDALRSLGGSPDRE